MVFWVLTLYCSYQYFGGTCCPYYFPKKEPDSRFLWKTGNQQIGVLNQKTTVFWSCKIVKIYFCPHFPVPVDLVIVGFLWVRIMYTFNYLLWHLWHFNQFLHTGQVRSYTDGFLSVLGSAPIPQFAWQCADFLRVTRHSGYCFGICFHSVMSYFCHCRDEFGALWFQQNSKLHTLMKLLPNW